MPFVGSTSASIASHPAFLTLRNAPRLEQDQIALFLRLAWRQAKFGNSELDSSAIDGRKVALNEAWQYYLGKYGARHGALVGERPVIVAAVDRDHEVEFRK